MAKCVIFQIIIIYDDYIKAKDVFNLFKPVFFGIVYLCLQTSIMANNSYRFKHTKDLIKNIFASRN